jgi:hypothetical protein
MADIPTFGQVTTIIQSAISKVSKSTQLSPGMIPSDAKMLLNAINHCRQNNWYEPPHRRNMESPAQSTTAQPQSNQGKFSIEKATFYRGKGHTKSLKERFGYNCLYCGSQSHWYSDCNLFWDDVRHGRVQQPPPNHSKKGSKYVPPTRNTDSYTQQSQNPPRNPSNGRIQKIYIPDANEGTILLDSGSTVNVSGTSCYFSITSKLKTPLMASLAISKYVAPIEFIGTGMMIINDVYYCNEIQGSILLTGRLVEEGWLFTHNKTKAQLQDKSGKICYLKFHNHCWKVDVLQDHAMIDKVSQKPSDELSL